MPILQITKLRLTEMKAPAPISVLLNDSLDLNPDVQVSPTAARVCLPGANDGRGFSPGSALPSASTVSGPVLPLQVSPLTAE